MAVYQHIVPVVLFGMILLLYEEICYMEKEFYASSVLTFREELREIKINLKALKEDYLEKSREVHSQEETQTKYFYEEINIIKNELKAMEYYLKSEISEIWNNIKSTQSIIHGVQYYIKEELPFVKEKEFNISVITFREELHEMKIDLKTLKEDYLGKFREVQNQTETKMKYFYEEMNIIRNESKAMKDYLKSEIIEIWTNIKSTQNIVHGVQYYIKDEIPSEINYFKKEITAITDNVKEKYYKVEELEATSKKLRSFLECHAYFLTLLSAQTTKGLFIHDLWRRELHADSMEFRFSTLQKTVFMSENKKILSNTNFPSAVAGSADISQQGYYGAKTDRKIAKEQELRLVFFTRIELKKTCDFEFLFHVTFCNDEIKINSGEQGTPHCFSMHAYCDAEKIEVFFMEPEDDDLATLTSYTEGNILIFGFEVNVSGIHGTVSFKELHSGRELHTFKSVDFSIPLIPMFSVSEPDVAESLIILV